MCDQWMTRQELPLTAEQIERLPRSPAWQYAAMGDRLILWPRTRAYHAALALNFTVDHSEPWLASCRSEDEPELVAVFEAAFRDVVPYAGLDNSLLHEAAQVSLRRTFSGQDGPMVSPACVIARQKGQVCGALLVTILPPGDNRDLASWYWQEPLPTHWQEIVGGRPHLTWIFVHPEQGRNGLATVMLRNAADRLKQLGFSTLLSTFLLGNDASLLWHWKSGFELLPTHFYPAPFTP